ncbi:hypothetical protein PMm318_A50870 [Pseudomonas moorei]
METYRIEKAVECWVLFKGASVRPMARAAARSDIIQIARREFFGRSVCIKIRNADGTREELRV